MRSEDYLFRIVACKRSKPCNHRDTEVTEYAFNLCVLSVSVVQVCHFSFSSTRMRWIVVVPMFSAQCVRGSR